MTTDLQQRTTSASSEADYLTLTTAAGFLTLTDRLIVRMVGDDRVAFMHGICSNDVKSLKQGEVAFALLLTEHAHVVADLYIWAEKEALLLEVDRSLWPAARTHLERFLVADDVEIEQLNSLQILALEGPAASTVLAGVLGDYATHLPPWRFVQNDDLLVARLPRLDAPGFTILANEAKVQSLAAQLQGAGARPIAAEALEILRIERGVARVGVDTDEKTIALEARLNAAISFEKGCYVGQETIERATARGGIKKRLLGLRLSGARSPERGALVLLDGKEVGHISSSGSSPRLGALAMSILHQSAGKAGTKVAVKDSGGEQEAIVCELPFERDFPA